MSRRKPELIELDVAELRAIVDLTRTSALGAGDHEKLEAVVETFLWMRTELEKSSATLARLRKDLSINAKKTEKTAEVLNRADGNGEKPKRKRKKKKPKGHGRNGADAYEGAEKIEVPHESLNPGDACPTCENGKVYILRDPHKLVRVTGQAPIQATVYKFQRLRCNLCGEVFRAKAPADVGEEKYDATSASMIGLLKY